MTENRTRHIQFHRQSSPSSYPTTELTLEAQIAKVIGMRLFEGTEFDIPPTCDRCGKLESACGCGPPPKKQIPPEKQLLQIRVEKRKKGKWVTVVRGLADGNEYAELLTQLKNHCGAGGTVKDATIEIQGDHAERMRSFLKNLKFRVK